MRGRQASDTRGGSAADKLSSRHRHCILPETLRLKIGSVFVD
jgi:hypothetical protein